MTSGKLHLALVLWLTGVLHAAPPTIGFRLEAADVLGDEKYLPRAREFAQTSEIPLPTRQ